MPWHVATPYGAFHGMQITYKLIMGHSRLIALGWILKVTSHRFDIIIIVIVIIIIIIIIMIMIMFKFTINIVANITVTWLSFSVFKPTLLQVGFMSNELKFSLDILSQYSLRWLMSVSSSVDVCFLLLSVCTGTMATCSCHIKKINKTDQCQ